MRKEGCAEFVGGGGGGEGAAAAAAAAAEAGAGGDVVFLYWRKPEEWAALVETYVEETGQKGSVLTVYELTEGEGTRGKGMSPSYLSPRSPFTSVCIKEKSTCWETKLVFTVTVRH